MSDLNDPRVLFAAERTLLSWNRTSLTLMGFGFMIERFGLFLRLMSLQHVEMPHNGGAHWVGISFILLGALASIYAIIQYRKILSTLKPIEIPTGYNPNGGVYLNSLIALLGIILSLMVPDS